MKRILALTIILGIAVTSCVARDASADFKKYLTGMLPKFVKALETCDTAFLDKMSTPDFTIVEGGRTVKKAESLAQMKQMSATVKPTKGKMNLISAKVVNGKGIAMTYGKFHTIMKPDPKGKVHTMDMEIWYKETWVKSGNGWKVQKIVDAKPAKILMDGKPMDPSMMGGG